MDIVKYKYVTMCVCISMSFRLDVIMCGCVPVYDCSSSLVGVRVCTLGDKYVGLFV